LFAALQTATLDTSGGHVVVAMPQQALELSEDGLGKDGAGSVLSRRELEILLLAARGMSNRQVASRLGIAEGTIKRQRG
jgi:ATP/maltotriose-dependent transcriptional regulator MalT